MYPPPLQVSFGASARSSLLVSSDPVPPILIEVCRIILLEPTATGIIGKQLTRVSRLSTDRALVTLHELEVSPRPEPMKEVERNLLHGRCRNAKVLHCQNLIRTDLSIVLLLRHGRNVVLGPKVDKIGGEAGLALVLQDPGGGFGNALGYVGHDRLLAGDVVNELSQLPVRVVLLPEAVDGLTLVLVGFVDYAGDGVGDVGHVDWLG
mmetsp:Transcript_22455/g.49986  ORF Transcript_22455/g.49986 Transcript_22455/m.49986 type:complete len:207 (-) Transcript_22455:313-933(-)